VADADRVVDLALVRAAQRPPLGRAEHFTIHLGPDDEPQRYAESADAFSIDLGAWR
jgi:hypothetical protein